MFFSKEQIEQSLKRLSNLDPFLGMTFLAFKKVQLPIGKAERRSDLVSALEIFLRQYYQPMDDYPGFYIPFQKWNDEKKPWNSDAFDVLRVLVQQRFTDVLMLQGTGRWGWRTNYIDVITSKYLKNGLVPVFDLAVWLFHSRPWQNNIESADVIEEFFTEFFIDQNERKLFDVSLPPLANPWLEEHPISTKALLNILSDPPDRIIEGILQKIDLTGIGPADQLELELASRLNIITGDNGLGKTFLLECVWYALTEEWIGYPARPRRNAIAPSIAFQIGQLTNNEKFHLGMVKYNRDRRRWDLPTKKSNTLPGLCIFAQVDGSFAVWDPAKAILTREESHSGQITNALTRFSRSSILHGSSTENPDDSAQRVTGLINDWVRWQESVDQTHFEALKLALYKLSPHPDQEALIPGLPTRMPEFNDSRKIPTLRFSYGDVPIVHCSAGIQRIVSLAYLLIWAWQEHIQVAESIHRKPAQSIVLLIDEMEAHLHPFWQRTILPALISTLQLIVRRNDKNVNSDLASINLHKIKDSTYIHSKIDVTKINERQQKQLLVALLSAFPTLQDLEMAVSYGLNENLSSIATHSTLEDTVLELLQWAIAQGRLEELIIAALQQNSQNPQLISVAQQLELRSGQSVALGSDTDATPSHLATSSSDTTKDEVQIQAIVATHSPLVLASAEPLFDHDQDKLFHLYLEDGLVQLNEVLFVKKGRADHWLTSPLFGLAQPRSLEAENAIKTANQLQLQKDPSIEAVQKASDDLAKFLAPDDEFWPRWIYFAEQRGVSL